MATLQIGDIAPNFSLYDQDEKLINLRDSLGKFVVIYFYPKALTPGCTTQACDIRDNWQQLLNLGVIVYGISPDKPKLLNKFKEQERLPFTLLSDIEHKVAEAYGTWQEKSMYGRKYMGMARDTFVLDRSGMVIGMLQKVKPSEHIRDVIAILSKYSEPSV